jgi:hypothetical protein
MIQYIFLHNETVFPKLKTSEYPFQDIGFIRVPPLQIISESVNIHWRDSWSSQNDKKRICLIVFLLELVWQQTELWNNI